MPLSLDNFKNQPPIVILNDDEIAGLSEFKNKLEKLFFAKALVRNSSFDGQTVNLVIEISCNFKLWEAITNLEGGIWAQTRRKQLKAYANSTFYNLIGQLRRQNNFDIDVEEISILFQNCTLIINKIYQDSIPKQLDSILTKLSEHYSQITKNSFEVPYEIFIPVFEETRNISGLDSSILVNIGNDNHRKKVYFKYWGLYLKSSEDALIYDFKNARIISGELEMLNH